MNTHYSPQQKKLIVIIAKIIGLKEILVMMTFKSFKITLIKFCIHKMTKFNKIIHH